jgi:hypothetical protein
MAMTIQNSSPSVSFSSESSKQKRLDASAFRGRVPVVFAFVGPSGDPTDAAIRNLDAALARFGERRVQLLVVVDGHPADVARRLAVDVPLITDDGLANELGVRAPSEEAVSIAVLGNDGALVECATEARSQDIATAILQRLDGLAKADPDRFGILPDSARQPERNEVDDQTGGAEDGPSFRQRLSWLTGDRDREAEALAKAVVAEGSSASETEVADAAKRAVSEAHGDTSVSENDPITSDVAKVDDVINKL